MSTATRSNPDRPRRERDLGQVLGRSMPAAVEHEMCLLGAMMLDQRVISDVMQVLEGEEDFFRSQHQAIYKVLCELFDKNIPLELPQINQRLRELGVLEQIGGTAYLIELVESVPSALSASYYAKVVHETALKRRLIDVAGKVLEGAFDSPEDVGEQLDAAEAAIFALAKSRNIEEASHLKELLQQTYEQLEASEGKYLTGLDCGFADLNDMTSGLQKGEMIIIAARPSMGKTAFALNMAEHIAATNKTPVAIFSLEMGKQQLAQRLLSSRSGVDSHKIRRNMLSSDDFQRLAMIVGELSEAPLYIDDTPGLDMLTMMGKSRRLVERYGIQAIMIDYLQLMAGPKSESRQQEVTALSRGIKALARELNIPVLCLSQLNRGPESREGHRPRMSDLRESGSIEQDADVVMMLHREEYYHNDPNWAMENPDKVGTAECIIAKQRNGPTGTVELQFDKQTLRFRDLAKGTGY